MSVGIVTRTWAFGEAEAGHGWTHEQKEAFREIMREASAKQRGAPVLVKVWDCGRSNVAWYDARAGHEEVALRDKCRAIFGVRERHCGEDWRMWGKTDEGPSPRRILR